MSKKKTKITRVDINWHKVKKWNKKQQQKGQKHQ